MSFRLVPTSVTLNDLERSNGRSANLVAFGAHCVEVVEDMPLNLCDRNVAQSF